MHALTGGNPFFVSEVLCAEGEELPASARDAVLARAARLSPPGRGVLDAAALVGERVEPALLAAVTGADVGALDEPVAAGLLVADGAVLRFRHEIARRAVEQEVGPHTGAEIHRRILAELRAVGGADDARLAHHAEGALDGEAVVRYARLAGDRSAAAGLTPRGRDAVPPRAAVRRRRRAAASGPTCSTSWAASSPRLDQWAAAAEALEESVELWRAAGVPLREGDALRRLSRCLLPAVSRARVSGARRAALEVLEPLGPSRELAWACRAMAGAYMGQRAARRVRRVATRARELAEPWACSTWPATR